MKNSSLLSASIVKTIFVSFELLALIAFCVIYFQNDRSPWFRGWGLVLGLLMAPMAIYIIANTIFNACNLHTVIRRRHTAKSIQRYYEWTKVFLISSIIVSIPCVLFPLPILLFENILLFVAYNKEQDEASHT